MGLFEHFPYTNFHNVNLDWLLTKMKELLAQMEALTEQVTALAQQVSTLATQLQTLTSTVSQISTRLTTAEGKIQTLESDVAEMSQDLEELRSDVAEIQEITDIRSLFTGSNCSILGASKIARQGDRVSGYLVVSLNNASANGYVQPATEIAGGSWAPVFTFGLDPSDSFLRWSPRSQSGWLISSADVSSSDEQVMIQLEYLIGY